MARVSSKTECLALGCHATTAQKFCDKHKAQRTTHRRGSNPKPYQSKAWRELRALVLARDPICKGLGERGDGCTRPSKHADHIQPWRQGGQFLNPANVQGLCHSCHSRKTQAGQ